MDKQNFKAKKLRLKILANIFSNMGGSRKKAAAVKRVKTTAGKGKTGKNEPQHKYKYRKKRSI